MILHPEFKSLDLSLPILSTAMPGGVQPAAEGEARHLLQQAEPLARLLQDLRPVLRRSAKAAQEEAVDLRRGRGGGSGHGRRRFSGLGDQDGRGCGVHEGKCDRGRFLKKLKLTLARDSHNLSEMYTGERKKVGKYC